MKGSKKEKKKKVGEEALYFPCLIAWKNSEASIQGGGTLGEPAELSELETQVRVQGNQEREFPGHQKRLPEKRTSDKCLDTATGWYAIMCEKTSQDLELSRGVSAGLVPVAMQWE